MVKRTLLVMLCCLFSMGMLASLAGAADTGAYVNLQGGATWVEDADFDFDVPAPFSFSGEAEFDTGFNVGAAAGYDFGMARLEAEVAYRENEADKLSGTISDGIETVPFAFDADGDVSALSFMVNGYWDMENETAFTPYLGAGIGMANVDFDDDDDTVFAYQFAAGIGFDITETIVLDIGYRYFATDDPETDSDLLPGIDVETEYKTHNANLGFRFMF